MPRLTIDELQKMRERAAAAVALRAGQARARITMHLGTCGIAAGAREVMAALLKEIETRGLTDVVIVTSGCAGLCSREPMATIELRGQPPVKYVELTPEKIRRIFERHVMGGTIVTESALATGSETTG